MDWIDAIFDNLCIIEQEGGIDYVNTAFTYLFAAGAISDTQVFM